MVDESHDSRYGVAYFHQSESSYIHTHPLTPSTEPLIPPTVTSNSLAKQPAPSHSQTHRIYWPSAFRRPSFWLECVFRARTKFLCSAHNYRLLPALDLCSAVFVGNGARNRDGARCNGEGVTQRADAGSVAGRWGPMLSYTRGHHFSGRNLNMSYDHCNDFPCMHNYSPVKVVPGLILRRRSHDTSLQPSMRRISAGTWRI